MKLVSSSKWRRWHNKELNWSGPRKKNPFTCNSDVPSLEKHPDVSGLQPPFDGFSRTNGKSQEESTSWLDKAVTNNREREPVNEWIQSDRIEHVSHTGGKN